MIAHLRGIVLSKDSDRVLVDVGGVGYAVTVSTSTALEIPPETTEASLFIYTHVREDQLTLFGFLSPREKKLFEQLITVNGVGPKLAMTVLSGGTVGKIIDSILRGDIPFLKATPGIGQKVAERIVMELKGKLEWEPPTPSRKKSGPDREVPYDEALSALTNLGYTPVQAEQALRKLDWTSAPTLQEAIKEGLRQLGRGS